MYWWGDGFYGVGDVTLRRFVLITCNFLPVNCLLLPAGSTSWQGVCCLSAASSDFWKTLLADFQRLRSQPPTKPRRQTAHALPASAYPPHLLRIPSTSALALPTPILYNHLIQHPTPFCDPKLRFCCITQETRRPT